jgi:hypothetical protein
MTRDGTVGRRIVGPTEGYTGGDCLHRLERDLALTLVVAGVDERHWPLELFVLSSIYVPA